MAHAHYIYRIIKQAEWHAFRESGYYEGNDLDRKDGFIHLSSDDQLSGTLKLYFAGQTDVMVLKISVDLLAAEKLEWEVSRDVQLFPHYYDPLPMSSVIGIFDVIFMDNGADYSLQEHIICSETP